MNSFNKKFIIDQDEAYEHPETYRVFVEDEFRFACDPSVYPTLKDVIDVILMHIATLRSDGLKDWDLAVWQSCRIVAVIRTQSESDPSVTIFGVSR